MTMSEDDNQPDDDSPSRNPSDGVSRPDSQEVHFSHVSALVPERVRRGVFSTGAVVLQGAHEFIVDFLLRMTRPHQVAARVVMPPQVVARLIAALSENLDNYERTFGRPAAQSFPPPVTPQKLTPTAASANSQDAETTPAAEQSTTAQELYDQLKLPDDVLSGAYANAVMIGHTATEFSFDFITTFFPRSAVSCRVYLAAPNAPRFLESLRQSFEQYEQKLRAQQPPGQPPASPTNSD